MQKSLLSSLLLLLPITIHAQSSGPNTPPLGSIVPEDLTFSIADTTVADLSGGSSLGQLSLTDYNDFADQVIIAVYHASW